MGTRGTFGVRVNGEDKLMYNHFDSYPTGLGKQIIGQTIEMLKEWGIDKLKEKAMALKQITEEDTPTEEHIKLLERFTDLDVSSKSKYDYYCLFRKLHGELKEILELGLMLDGNDFIKDSLFCEWGYILNLDEEILEIYRGFQKKNLGFGRYNGDKIDSETSDYYGCALIQQIPFGNLIIGGSKILDKIEDFEDITIIWENTNDESSNIGVNVIRGYLWDPNYGKDNEIIEKVDFNEKVKAMIDTHIIHEQTLLVHFLLDYENYDIQEEIHQWWIVTDWLYERLKEKGEVVVQIKDFGNWWGRTCCGISLKDTPVLIEITEDLIKKNS